MARSDCKLCGREDVEEIEAIALDRGPRAAAKVAGCSHNSVMRHMANHTGTTPVSPAVMAQELKASRPTTARLPQVAAYVAGYKAKYPELATITSMKDRRAYVANLFRLGRFNGLRTAGHLSLMWDDLGPVEFAELITTVAMETNFRRGADQARRVALLGRIERLIDDSIKEGDRKTAARLIDIYARYDVPVGMDIRAELINSQAFPIVAKVLREQSPETFDAIHGAIVAEETRRRQALVPATLGEAPEDT